MKYNKNTKRFLGNKNIALIGMPGCGKTTIGKILSERLNIPFYDVDKHIEIEQGKTISNVFSENGEAFFRKLESSAIKKLSQKSPAVIATGGGAVKTSENMNVLKDNSIIFFINRDIENIITDINTEVRPLLTDGISQIYNLFEERYPLYKKYSQFEVTNEGSIDDVVNKIIEIINNIK